MKDLGQTLASELDNIIKRWTTIVYQADSIQSTQHLTYDAVRNSIPKIIEELALLLSQTREGSCQELKEHSLDHGHVRAQQGYDTAEIVREYRLLREVIIDTLEEALLTGSPSEILQAVRTIDRFVGTIVTTSLESYVQERLVELDHMQRQLTLTNQELERLLQVQKDNLSFMAHELKDPLNSIIGHSNLLLQQQRKQLKESSSSTNLEQLERVLRNGRKLLKIINDALEISRYHQGQIQFNLETVDIRVLIQETLRDILEELAIEKGLTLTADLDAGPQHLVTDALRLQQVVTNLVSNAIRYTDAGSVRITCQQLSPQTWSLVVADTGMGIAPEDQDRVFEAYARTNASSRSSIGSGLGLAIVKQIVERMHGTITLVSELNQGTEITVTLPIELQVSQALEISRDILR